MNTLDRARQVLDVPWHETPEQSILITRKGPLIRVGNANWPPTTRVLGETRQGAPEQDPEPQAINGKHTKGIDRMNATETQRAHVFEAGSLLNEAASRSAAEAIGAVAAVILAVIGLAGELSYLLASIATVVIGAGILVEGWALGSRYRQASSTNAVPSQELGTSGALTAEFLGGIAGVVLGILALFRMAPDTLLATALLVYGATLL